MLKQEKKFLRPQKSIFHTNELRESVTIVHLFIVFLSLVSALSITIIFAETRAIKFPVAAQKTTAFPDEIDHFSRSNFESYFMSDDRE